MFVSQYLDNDVCTERKIVQGAGFREFNAAKCRQQAASLRLVFRSPHLVQISDQ